MPTINEQQLVPIQANQPIPLAEADGDAVFDLTNELEAAINDGFAATSELTTMFQHLTTTTRQAISSTDHLLELQHLRELPEYASADTDIISEYDKEKMYWRGEFVSNDWEPIPEKNSQLHQALFHWSKG